MSQHWPDVVTSSSNVTIELEDQWLWFQPMSLHSVTMSRHWLNVTTLSSQCRDIGLSMLRHSSVDVTTLGFDVETLAQCRDIGFQCRDTSSMS